MAAEHYPSTRVFDGVETQWVSVPFIQADIGWPILGFRDDVVSVLEPSCRLTVQLRLLLFETIHDVEQCPITLEALPEINDGVVDVGDCFTFDLNGEVTQPGYVPICQIPILRFREGFSSEAGAQHHRTLWLLFSLGFLHVFYCHVRGVWIVSPAFKRIVWDWADDSWNESFFLSAADPGDGWPGYITVCSRWPLCSMTQQRWLESYRQYYNL